MSERSFNCTLHWSSWLTLICSIRQIYSFQKLEKTFKENERKNPVTANQETLEYQIHLSDNMNQEIFPEEF